MTKIHQAFENKKAFIPFITAGDPSIAVTEELILAMERAGADLIEIGIPFSDPMAEGPVIQQANARALSIGCTTDEIFAMVRRVRLKTEIPLVFLTYLNPIFTYGKEQFMERCAACGIDGLIVPDMPFEEKGELLDTCARNNVDIISMLAPTSKERITRISESATGFLYIVSSLGVTGVRSEIKTDIAEIVAHIREATTLPCAVGFGVSTPAQARAMAAAADGAIVGSAIVKIIAEYGAACVPYVEAYVREMKQAVMQA